MGAERNILSALLNQTDLTKFKLKTVKARLDVWYMKQIDWLGSCRDAVVRLIEGDNFLNAIYLGFSDFQRNFP